MFRLETALLQRSKGHSVAGRVNYITGERLYDLEKQNEFREERDDIQWKDIILPDIAPSIFNELQTLCDAMEQAEKRRDARLARQYILCLPRKLPSSAHKRMIEQFVRDNFTTRNLCAIAAIHNGLDPVNVLNSNPHAHIIVSTRPVRKDGFSNKKDRILDSKPYLRSLMNKWKDMQNQECEKYYIPDRVSPRFRDSHEHDSEKAREHTFTIER